MNDDARLAACKQYLRRTYCSDPTDLTALKALGAAAFAEAGEAVTITGLASEVGSATGQVNFDKWIVVQAVEELLLELDPTAVEPPARGTIIDHSDNPVGT